MRVKCLRSITIKTDSESVEVSQGELYDLLNEGGVYYILDNEDRKIRVLSTGISNKYVLRSFVTESAIFEELEVADKFRKFAEILDVPLDKVFQVVGVSLYYRLTIDGLFFASLDDYKADIWKRTTRIREALFTHDITILDDQEEVKE